MNLVNKTNGVLRIAYVCQLILFQPIIISYLLAAVQYFAKSNKNALDRKFTLVNFA